MPLNYSRIWMQVAGGFGSIWQFLVFEEASEVLSLKRRILVDEIHELIVLVSHLLQLTRQLLLTPSPFDKGTKLLLQLPSTLFDFRSPFVHYSHA